MRKLLVALCLCFALNSAASTYTVMVDGQNKVVYPANNLHLTGTTWADVLNPTYLFINGVQLIPTTNGFGWVAGLDSNQVGSASGAITITNNPTSNDVLQFNGAFGVWSPNTGGGGGAGVVTGNDLNVSSVTSVLVQATVINASNVLANVVAADSMVLNGVAITDWTQGTNSGSGGGSEWSSYAATQTVNGGGFSFINIADVSASSVTGVVVQATVGNFGYLMATGASFGQIELGGTALTNWGQVTNGSGGGSEWSSYDATQQVDMAGFGINNVGDIYANSLTGNIVQATVVNASNILSSVASFDSITLNGTTITEFSGDATTIIGKAVTTNDPISGDVLQFQGSTWAATQLTNLAASVTGAVTTVTYTQSTNNNATISTNLTTLQITFNTNFLTPNGDGVLNGLTGVVVQATVGNFGYLMATGASFGQIELGGTTLTNWGQVTNGGANLAASWYQANTNSVTYSSSNLVVYFKTNYQAVGSYLTNETDPAFLVWKTNTYAADLSATSNNINNKYTLATNYAKSLITGDMTFSSVTAVVVQATVVNASNVLANVGAFDSVVIAGVTNFGPNSVTWSQAGSNYARYVGSNLTLIFKTNYATTAGDGTTINGNAVGAGAAGFNGAMAIGGNVTNALTNSTAIRGNLYLDGGSNIFYRAALGAGSFLPLSLGSFASSWSSNAATVNVNIGGYSITNINEIKSTLGTFSSITSPIANLVAINMAGQTISNWNTLTNVGAWASWPATNNIDFNNKYVTNATTISFGGGGSLSFNSTSNAFFLKGNE